MRFGHVLVIGAGQMGGGIAQVVAASGRRVSVHDPYPGAVERGLAAMRKSLTKLAEVIRALQTSDETATAIVELARDLGKEPAEVRDFPGFVSNRILMPFINEAAYALLGGVAQPEAIDTIAKLGFAHPMGPLALADLIGLDTCVAIMEVLRDGFGDDRYEPCPLLREHVAAGRLGRKSGQGFYDYS